MAIKVIDEIPQGIKPKSIRETIKDDIQEAIDKGISLFEFDGDYNYKTLAGNARTVVHEIKRKWLRRVQEQYFRNALTEDERTIKGFYVWHRGAYEYKTFWITISTVKGEERTRVFCKIDNQEEFKQRVIADCNADLVKTRSEMIIHDGRWVYKDRIREGE